MSRYKPADIARLGENAQKQIRLVQLAATMQELEQKRSNKFGAVRTEVDGRKFDSKAEAARYAELRLLHRSGRISELVCQPEFPISVNGAYIAKYIADFAYYLPDGTRVIEDCKSGPTKTPLYKLKKKLVECLHNLKIVEVE